MSAAVYKQSTLAAALIACSALSAHAQQPVPDAGRLLKEAEPLPPLPKPAAPELPVPVPPPKPAPAVGEPDVSFVLRTVGFSGNTVFSSAELGALVTDKIGRSVTFADLEEIAARVTDHYRRAGFPRRGSAAAAGRTRWHPRDLGDRRSARFGPYRAGTGDASPRVVRGERARAARSRTVLREADLERSMLILADIPEYKFSRASKPGINPARPTS